MSEGRLVFDGAHLRATAFEVEGSRSLIALFGHYSDKEGFAAATPSQFFANKGFSQIRIQTSRNDFYLNEDLRPARRAIFDYTKPFSRVCGMGFSMGGFGCLLLARALHLQEALLISPLRRLNNPQKFVQSVDMAEEAGFFSYPRGRHNGIHLPLRGCLLFDPWVNGGHDRDYARIVGQLFPAVQLVAMPGCGHPASARLTRMGRFGDFQRLVARGGMTANSFRGLHRQTRVLDPGYVNHVADRVKTDPSAIEAAFRQA